MEIGIKLKNARTEKGLTQEHAAELLGVSRQTVSNWENNKSYPDIISVIKMSDIYSVSLDHLLKEEVSVDKSYRDFLEESTSTVKAKRKVEKIILFSAYFIVWAIALLVTWLVKAPVSNDLNLIFKWILLPLMLLTATVIVAKNDYFGKGNWFCILAAALTFLTVPFASYVEMPQTSEGMASLAYVFIFPDFTYMLIGAVISAVGITVGTVWNKRKKTEK